MGAVSRKPWKHVWVCCGAIAALAFVVACSLAWKQVLRTRVIMPLADYQRSAWTAPPFAEFTAEYPYFPYGLVSIPSWVSDDPEASPHRPVLWLHVPHRTSGYVVHITSVRMTKTHPALLEVQANGVTVGHFVGRVYYPWEDNSVGVAAVHIPGRLLHAGRDNEIRIVNHGGAYRGRMALVRHGDLWRVLSWWLPLSVGALLFAWHMTGGRRARAGRWTPVVLAGVSLPLFLYTGFVRTFARAGGFVLDDAEEILESLILNRFNFDMSKHLLFLPAFRGLWEGVAALGGTPEYTAILVFSLVAALLVAAGFVLLRVVLRGDAMALAASAASLFSFSLWYYGSVTETYAFSALLTVVALLGIRATPCHRAAVWSAAAGLLVGLAALAHEPLGILLGVLAVRLAFAPGTLRRRAGLFLLALAAFAFVRYFGEGAIEAIYGRPRGPTLAHRAKYGWDRVTLILSTYGDVRDMTWPNLGSVVLGQTLHAFVGQPLGHLWGGQWRGAAAAVATLPAALTTAVSGVVLLAALAGLARDVAYRRRTVALALCVCLPYIAFFWYFNPEEMLLYSSPMMIPLVAWLARGVQIALPRYGAVLVAVWAAALLFYNAPVIATFH